MSDQKSFAIAEFKATSDHGEFEALVSVFGNVDKGGDRVMPGAFAKTLAQWRASGDPIPVIWNHQWDNPLAHIGKVDPAQAQETADGLLVHGTLDLDNEFAAQVHRLMAERRVKELSFGYNVVDAERKNGALELHELELIEVGPTLRGMNPDTELLVVKALEAAAATEPETKAGARLSRDTKAELGKASELAGELQALLDNMISADSAVQPSDSQVDGKAGDGTPSNADEDLRIRLQLMTKEK